MKIAILTSGTMPVPAVRGGAVENLIDSYLEYNNQHRIHDITIYSIWHPDIKKHPALYSDVNHYQYIKMDTLWAKIKKAIYKRSHQDDYYQYTIEYFFEQAFCRLHHQDFDIIIVENRPGYVLKLKNRISTPCILHLHNDFLNTNTPQSTMIFSEFNRILCVSDYILNRVQKINPQQLKTLTVNNSIDCKRFIKATPMQREEHGISNKDFVIVYSGRLNKEKGILPLIQAVIKLQAIPHLKLLIIGASSYGVDKHTTSFVRQLEKEAESIRNQVIFTGYINYMQVPSYLKMADVAVVPSMWEEPFGLTVVEAMAAGLPLITTRSGGIPEICEGVATIVERENIVDNLAAAILDLYQHPEKRQKMAAASLERSKLFDKETYAKNFFAALESL